jgi:hypothetical protein
MRVFNVSDFANPSEVAVPPYYNSNSNTPVRGNYAYIAWPNIDSGSLTILDVSNPANPTEVASLPDIGARNLRVEGNHLYMQHSSNNASLLSSYDISNPTNPTLAWTAPSNNYGQMQSLSIKNRIAYGGAGGTLKIYDTINETLTSMELPEPGVSCVRDSAIAGNYLYLGYSRIYGPTLDSTLLVYDISSPLNPSLVETYSPYFSETTSIAIMGDQLLMGGNNGKLEVLDITNPTSISQIQSLHLFSASKSLTDISVSGSNVFIGTQDSFAILTPEPATLLLLGFGAVIIRRRRTS